MYISVKVLYLFRSNHVCVRLCVFASVCALARAVSLRSCELLPEGKKMFICIVIWYFSIAPHSSLFSPPKTTGSFVAVIPRDSNSHRCHCYA